MKVKALREFYGDTGNVRAGELLTVTRTTGNELVANKLAEIVDDTDEDEKEDGTMTEKQGEKQAAAPTNKAAQKSENKAAPSTEKK